MKWLAQRHRSPGSPLASGDHRHARGPHRSLEPERRGDGPEQRGRRQGGDNWENARRDGGSETGNHTGLFPGFSRPDWNPSAGGGPSSHRSRRVDAVADGVIGLGSGYRPPSGPARGRGGRSRWRAIRSIRAASQTPCSGNRSHPFADEVERTGKSGADRLSGVLLDADEPNAFLGSLRRIAERKAHSFTRGLIQKAECEQWWALADALSKVEREIHMSA